MRGISRTIVLLACALAIVVAAPSMALAFEQRGGDSVTVTESISDDLYVVGTSVDVSGDVTGDVIAFGTTIEISGNVTGDVIAAGTTIRVSGTVGGSVRAAGTDVRVTGDIAEDVVAAAGTLRVTGESSVGRDAVIAAGDANLDADVRRNVLAGAGTLTISSTVGGDVRAEVDDLELTDDGTIEGDLTYFSDSEADLRGEVGGETQRREPRVGWRGTAEPPSAAGAVMLAVLAWIRGLIGMAIFAVLTVLALRGFAGLAADEVFARPLPSIGIGIAIFALVVPASIFIFLVGIFIGGWWIAFVLMALVWILALVGFVVASVAVGRWVLSRIGSGVPHPILSALVGLLIIWLIGIIPFVGWLAGFAAVLFGMGAIVLALYARPSVPPAVMMPGPAEQPPYPAAPPVAPPSAPPVVPPRMPPTEQPPGTPPERPSEPPPPPTPML